MTQSGQDVDPDVLRRGRLRVERSGAVLTVVLDRPEIRNAQLPETWEALERIGSTLPRDVRVVVVRGAGPSFSAGLDRSAFRPGPQSPLGRIALAPEPVAHDLIAQFQRGFTWLSDPGFISVAAVGGHAIGAGFQLALACDLIVAADDASFSMAEVTLGLVPDLTGTARLVRAIGRQRALEICVTGRRVQAVEAERIGLTLMTVPRADLDRRVGELVAALTAADAEAVRAVTRLITGAETADPTDQLAAERAEQIRRIKALAAALPRS